MAWTRDKQLTTTPSKEEMVEKNILEENVVLKQRIESLERELHHWKSNHKAMVHRCAMLRDRPDLPVDRIPAYRELIRLQRLLGLVDEDKTTEENHVKDTLPRILLEKK